MVVPEDGVKWWGTWEELILAGAVLRHGTLDWNSVASELQSRTLCPFNFTPEVCRAKYEDLQRYYSGYTSWFEELKKRRVDELKKALEQSEDSIGSLKSKLEALKAEKTCSNLDCSSNDTNSLVQFQKFEGDESFGKETSKDGLSAGSFTEETQPIRFSHFQPRVKVLEEKVSAQPSVSDTLEGENSPCIVKIPEAIHLERGFSIRKKRGERKRKGQDLKEAYVGENNLMGLSNAEAKEKEHLAYDRGPIFVESSSNSEDLAQCSKQGLDNLMSVLNAVLEDEQASIFQRKMDAQKRARYKKLIRKHMDFDTIRLRISNKVITTLRELFRDLLLLANNALVFYSKTTREYKCGLALRKLVTGKLRKNDETASKKVRKYGNSLVHRPLVTTGGACLSKNDDSTVMVYAKGSSGGRRGKVGAGKRGNVDVVQAKALTKTRKKPRIAN